MSLIIEKKQGILIVHLEGRIGIHESFDVESNVRQQMQNGEHYFIFNLEKVSYISSSGIRIFVSTHNYLQDKNGAVRLVGMNSDVEKVFKLIELLDLFANYHSIDEAIASLSID